MYQQQQQRAMRNDDQKNVIVGCWWAVDAPRAVEGEGGGSCGKQLG